MMVEEKVDPPDFQAESPPLAVEAPKAEDPPPTDLNTSQVQGNPPDEEANDIPTKDISENSTESPPNEVEDTFLGGESDADERSDDSSNKRARGRGRGRYTMTRNILIYAFVFLVIAAAVTIFLALRMGELQGKNDTATATPPPFVFSGELQIPAPEDGSAAPSEEEAPLRPPLPEEGKTDAPTTIAPSPFETPYSTPRRTSEEFTIILPPLEPQAESPTDSPITIAPTPKPTQRTYNPTPQPTPSPTNRPTPRPTAAATPKPTPTRTPRPTAAPIGFDITKTPLFRYLNVLGTPAEVLADPSTPQGKAIRWLMEPGVETISVFRVPQRYALVALDFALHEQEIKVLSAWQAYINAVQGQSYSPWRNKKRDACDWEGVTCDVHKEVTGIKWSRQDLKGRIIPEIKLLSKLEVVDLAENQIKGTLDPFWDLPELTHLYLFRNRFSGQIPADRHAPTNLTNVYLGHNDLTGPLPLTLTSSRFKGPGNLRYLILHHNQLNGTLPEGMRLRNLFYLDLSNNDFQGPVPTDWAFYFQQLRFLYLANNRLSGELPEDFDMLGNGRLKQLYIENNKFSGEFPTKNWDDFFMTNMNIAGNNFDKAKNLCKISVFEGGELVELRAQCDFCSCEPLCQNCFAVSKQGNNNNQVAKTWLLTASSSAPESSGSP